AAPAAMAVALASGQPCRGFTRRRSVSPKFAIARAAAPMFSPNCGWERMIEGGAIRRRQTAWLLSFAHLHLRRLSFPFGSVDANTQQPQSERHFRDKGDPWKVRYRQREKQTEAVDPIGCAGNNHQQPENPWKKRGAKDQGTD